MFLSYRIERAVFPGFESDTFFSLNTLSKNVFDISNFNVVVSEEKLDYLLKKKKGNLDRAGMIGFTTRDLEALINRKINDNYIYRISYRVESENFKIQHNNRNTQN